MDMYAFAEPSYEELLHIAGTETSAWGCACDRPDELGVSVVVAKLTLAELMLVLRGMPEPVAAF